MVICFRYYGCSRTFERNHLISIHSLEYVSKAALRKGIARGADVYAYDEERRRELSAG
jgi:hypothetical protein